MGVEPTLPPWQDGRQPLHHGRDTDPEHPAGLAPATPPWEGGMLLLHHGRTGQPTSVGPGGLEPPPVGLRGPDAAASTLIPFPAPETQPAGGSGPPAGAVIAVRLGGSSGIARGTELRCKVAEGGNRQAFQVARIPAGHGNCVTLLADRRFAVFSGPATAAAAGYVEIDASRSTWFARGYGILAGIGPGLSPKPRR